MSDRQFTNEELESMLEGWLDKIDKKRQAALDKKIAKDPYVQYLDKKLEKLHKALAQNKERIEKTYGKNSEYRRHLHNFRNF
jgi:predicted RNase H-like nuclease (RuvC/YqgF family)